MEIKSTGQAANLSSLKGNMKVSNECEIKDGFTPSDKSAFGDFLHNLADNIHHLFAKPGTPEKEGAFVPGPDGQGYVWCKHPDMDDYRPLMEKDDGGCFCLKAEACAPDVFYWRPYMDPQNEYGPYGMGGYMWQGDNNIVSIKNPDPKDYATGGKWTLDTACGGFSWWWVPDKPAEKPAPPANYQI